MTSKAFPFFPFEVARATAGAWEVFFLGGAMSVVKGYFEKWLGFESGRDPLSMDSKEILMKALNAVGNSRDRYPCTKLRGLMSESEIKPVQTQRFM